MVKRVLIFVIFSITSNLMKAQFDTQFSQNMFNRLSVNSATAGVSDAINLVALNRNQWSGLCAVKTTVFSGDMPITLFNAPSGIGLNIMNDEVGFFTNLTMSLNYAMHFELEKGLLSAGIAVGMLNQKLDGTKFELPEEGGVYEESDPNIPKTEVSGSALDLGLGVFYTEKSFYVGMSLSHLNKPKPNYKGEFNFNVSRTLYMTGGYNYKVKDSAYDILPSFFFKTDGRSSQVDLNTLIKYKKRYWGGLTYRFQDAIVIIGGIEMRNGVRFGYSYDFTTSFLSKSGNGGTHEVMIGYNFDISLEKRTKRYKSVRYL